MTEKDESPAWGEGVEVTPPKLYELEFRYAGVGLPENPLSTEYSLGLNRRKPLQLGVQFGASVTGVKGLTLRATYRMVFTLRDGTPESQEPEKAFKGIATRLAPVAMYPFVRETLLSVSQRALLTSVMLPIKNVGLLWAQDEIDIPEFEAADGDSEPDDGI